VGLTSSYRATVSSWQEDSGRTSAWQEHKSKGMFIENPQAVEMTQWFCAAVTMFSSMAFAMDKVNRTGFDQTSWQPQKGWIFSLLWCGDRGALPPGVLTGHRAPPAAPQGLNPAAQHHLLPWQRNRSGPPPLRRHRGSHRLPARLVPQPPATYHPGHRSRSCGHGSPHCPGVIVENAAGFHAPRQPAPEAHQQNGTAVTLS
jgi:hypothetical protein